MPSSRLSSRLLSVGLSFSLLLGALAGCSSTPTRAPVEDRKLAKPLAGASAASAGWATPTAPMRRTWLPTSIPNAASICRATEQHATRIAVSLADERSMTGRMSGPWGGRSKPYFCAPARSAWPGRGSVIRSTPAPSPATAIVSGQPARSL